MKINLGYIWLFENIKKRKKNVKKMIFFVFGFIMKNMK